MEEKIAALPYDVYSRMEAKKAVEGKPLSFLNIDRPETMFGQEQNMYDNVVYEAAKKRLWKMVEDGYFVKERACVFYLYELCMNGRSQTGVVACVSVDDYLNGVIKRHENTREEKELDRIRHVDICKAQTGPIFLSYRSRKEINEIIAELKKRKATFSFVSEDGVRHTGWQIQEKEWIQRLSLAFEKVQDIYIADGHHRAASAVKVSLKRRKEHPDYSGQEEFNYFLSVLFPDDQLMIMDYNRVIKDLNGLTKETFFEKVKEKFLVTPLERAAKPEEKGRISLYFCGKWYSLKTKKEYIMEHPVEGLDVAYLQREFFLPVLGILDPRTDNRVEFVGGIRGLLELERRVDSGMAAAFAMYPTSMQELFAVSDAGLLMPPKSTWFEPKLRSGLFIHEI